jgi:adenine-specific DNA-methyltransferase
LPLPKSSKNIFNNINKIVDRIISQKSQEKDTTLLEQEIDNLVYRLYELSYDEVKVIDPEFPLSQKEYENISLE